MSRQTRITTRISTCILCIMNLKKTAFHFVKILIEARNNLPAGHGLNRFRMKMSDHARANNSKSCAHIEFLS